MNAPQIILIVMLSAQLLGSAFYHGEKRGNVDLRVAMIRIAVLVGLLIWGGFFQ